MPPLPSTYISGKTCRFDYFTGTVLATRKQKETVLIGAADLGQSGANIVTANTVDHHELFLAGESGVERSFKIIDLDLPCREGNTVSVIWFTVDDTDVGAIIKLLNHTTGDRALISAQRLVPLFRRSMPRKVGIALAVFLIGTVVLDILWGVVLAFIVGVYFSWTALQGARRLLGSDALRSLDAELLRRNVVVANAS